MTYSAEDVTERQILDLEAIAGRLNLSAPVVQLSDRGLLIEIRTDATRPNGSKVASTFASDASDFSELKAEYRLQLMTDVMTAMQRDGQKRRKKLKVTQDDSSWWDHFKRSSVLASLVSVGAGLFSAAPSILEWVTGNRSTWEPLVPPGAAEIIMGSAALAAIVLRKLQFDRVERDEQ